MSRFPLARPSLNPRARALLVYTALLAVLFTASAVTSYVYKHEPVRDTLTVGLATATPSGGPRVISGTVSRVEAGRLVLTTEGGPVTIALPSSAAIEELQHAASGLPAGTAVNVGVLSTQYGLVLTGIVAIEAR